MLPSRRARGVPAPAGICSRGAWIPAVPSLQGIWDSAENLGFLSAKIVVFKVFLGFFFKVFFPSPVGGSGVWSRIEWKMGNFRIPGSGNRGIGEVGEGFEVSRQGHQPVPKWVWDLSSP